MPKEVLPSPSTRFASKWQENNSKLQLLDSYRKKRKVKTDFGEIESDDGVNRESFPLFPTLVRN